MLNPQESLFMDNLTKKHLQDIMTAIDEIEYFFNDTGKFSPTFRDNLCLCMAVEREIEAIGKAIKQDFEIRRDNSHHKFKQRQLMQGTISYMAMTAFLRHSVEHHN